MNDKEREVLMCNVLQEIQRDAFLSEQRKKVIKEAKKCPPNPHLPQLHPPAIPKRRALQLPCPICQSQVCIDKE